MNFTSVSEAMILRVPARRLSVGVSLFKGRVSYYYLIISDIHCYTFRWIWSICPSKLLHTACGSTKPFGCTSFALWNIFTCCEQDPLSWCICFLRSWLASSFLQVDLYHCRRKCVLWFTGKQARVGIKLDSPNCSRYSGCRILIHFWGYFIERGWPLCHFQH